MKQPAIQALLEPVVSTMGYELIGVEYISQGRHSVLRLYIDQDKGINVGDCEAVSRQVSAVLDVEDPISGQYSLEVSSPGLDRPLFTLEQFARFQGKEASVRLHSPLDGRRKFKGIIAQVHDENVVLQMESDSVEIPFDLIDKANLIPEVEF